MNIKKIGFLFILFFITTLCVASNPLVKASLDNSEYRQGDIIKILVNIENNPGLHGIYFDLNYDSEVLDFEGIRETSMIRRLIDKSKLSYAYSDPLTSASTGAHVIVSFALRGEKTDTGSNGALVELRFRVRDVDNQYHRFTFNDCSIIDKNKKNIAGVIWQDSENFKIITPLAQEYILIKKPYDNQIFYNDTIDNLSALCSDGEYTVRIYNEIRPDDYFDILTTDGKVLAVGGDNEGFSPVVLDPGFNNIIAGLYEDINGTLEPLNVYDRVKVYRTDESKNVKIIAPLDHSLINTDMVDVRVAVSTDNVEINGVRGNDTGETTNDGDRIFHSRIWLAKGFNTITAVSVDESVTEERLKYTDSIKVFYQKDDTIFRFLQPAADRIIKSTANTKLYIKGEIDSPYKTSNDPQSGGPIYNSVTLRVIYQPLNPLLKPITLVRDKEAKISENDYTQNDAMSRYIFYNVFPISLSNLEDGDIIIYAYKNKNEEKYDDLITRIIHIDNRRLWINLVQPSVFTSDILDTELKILDNNENKPILPGGDVVLSPEGSLRLADNEPLIKDTNLLSTEQIIETPDGTLYALSNTSNGIMKLYRKDFGHSSFTLALSRPGMSGYSLENSPIGILIGVSNNFTTENSGLYLWNGTSLTNISFAGHPTHVQFINVNKNIVYLYGDDYSDLYSFNIYSMEESGGKLKVQSLQKYPLSNNSHVIQFFLSKDAGIAMVRTDDADDSISFYKKSQTNVYDKIQMQEIDGTGNVTGKNVICGEYSTGEYYAFIIQKPDDQFEIVMLNKYTGKNIRNKIGMDKLEFSGGEQLIGMGFKEDNFTIVYRDNMEYKVKSGKLFFTTYFPDNNATDDTPYAENGSGISITGIQNIFISGFNQLYLGVAAESIPNNSNNKVFNFYKNLKSGGQANFNYINEELDGLTGFEFSVDPGWIENEGSIALRFDIREKSDPEQESDSENDTVIFGLKEEGTEDPLDLKILADIIDASEGKKLVTQYYTATSQYDAFLQKTIFHFEFSALQQNRYLSFKFQINAMENISPEVSDITVFKKMKVKMISPPGQEATLPIYGYVYDRTVNEIEVQHNTVELGWDGSFYFDYTINTLKKEIPVEVSCINSSGEKALISFSVELIESHNDVWDIDYKFLETDAYNNLSQDGGNTEFIFNSDEENMILSGKYYGLKNCITGYEISGYDSSTDSYVVLKRELLETAEISDRTAPLWQEIGLELGPEYEAGVFTDQRITLFPGEQRLVIYCENPGGLRSEYGVWNINNIEQPPENSSESGPALFDMSIDNTGDILIAEGKFQGQNGCIAGYELYEFKGKDDSWELVQSEIFDTVITGTQNDGSTVSGVFTNQQVSLPYRDQKVIIYCRNPNNERAEYVYQAYKLFPSINYNMPADMEKVDFNLDETVDYVVDFIKISHKILINAYEGTAPDFPFIREYEITGSVKSLFDFNNLKIRDISDYTGVDGRLYFENGLDKITIPVEAGNKFTIKIKVVMGRDELNQKFHIAAIPDLPRKNQLKRGIEIRVRKELKNTDFRAYFDEIKPQNWTPEEMENGKVEFKFKLNRDDLPLNDHVTAHLILNYIHEFAGVVYKKNKDDSVYFIKDIVPDPENPGGITKFNISDLRINAFNRLQWYFDYTDPLDKNIYTISSSTSGKEGMYDFLFEYNKESLTIPSRISVDPELTDQYYNTTDRLLPGITLIKDKETVFNGKLNGSGLALDWTAADDQESISTPLFNLLKEDIIEGRNDLTFEYEEITIEGVKKERVKSFTFYYDSKKPAVEIETYQIETKESESDYLNLLALTVLVTEANYKEVHLHYDNSIISAEPVVEINGKNRYRIIWDNLSGFDIRPSAEQKVKVEVRDHAGNISFSRNFEGLADIDRPIESFTNQVDFEMPVYDADDNSVMVGNEDNYSGRPFNRHTKFAPLKFIKRMSIKDSLRNDFDDILIIDDTGTEPYDTDLSIGEGEGKFLVFKFIKDPSNNIFTEEDIKDKIKFTTSGYKVDADSNTVTFQPIPIVLSSPNLFAYIDGYNHVYYIVLLDGAGLKGEFYANVNSFVQQCQEGETFSEGKLTVSFDNIEPADIYVTGGDEQSIEDIVVYDTNYEDPEHYRNRVNSVLEEENWNMINNLRGKEQVAFNPGDTTGALFGNAVAVSEKYAVVGASGDTNEEGIATGVVYIYEKNLFGEWDLDNGIKVTPEMSIQTIEFGYSVSVSGDYLIVGAPQDNENGVGTGAAYIYKKTGATWIKQDTLSAAVSTNGERFGHSVSISGDYAVVGVPFDSEKESEAGSAYVFKRNDDEWEQLPKLFPGDHQQFGEFGCSVSISGDYLVIGASGNNGSTTDSGAAYVFMGDGEEWLEQDKLYANDCEEYSEFGNSVSISGDYVIAGAYNDYNDNPSTGLTVQSGSAYVFKRNDIQWDLDDKLIPDDLNSVDRFGYSVSIHGEYAIAGSTRDHGSEDDSGSAYLFKKTESGWGLIKEILPKEETNNGEFGNSVAISGNDMLIGYARYNVSRGTVYFYRKSSGVDEQWGEENFVNKISSSVSSNFFGGSVSVSGDYAIAGARGEAYIFKQNGSIWEEQAILTTGDGVPHYYFGCSVSISDDYVIVGDYRSDNGRGSAYIFMRNGSAWEIQKILTADQEIDADRFGFSVSISGDYAIVGAPKSNGLKDLVFIFKRNGSTWEKQAILSSTGLTSGGFGSSVSISGDYAIVGHNLVLGNSNLIWIFKRNGSIWEEQAVLKDNEVVHEGFCDGVSISGDYALLGLYGYDNPLGSAYVFKRNGSVWEEQATLTASDGEASDRFGRSVSISANYAIIGTFLNHNDRGSACIFKRSGSKWEEQTRLTASDGEEFDQFGWSVSISGDYAIIGASGAGAYGSAYIYPLVDLKNFDQNQSDQSTNYSINKEPAPDPFSDSINLLPDDLTEYLIFKIKKSDSIQEITDIENQIKYMYIASGYDFHTSSQEDYQTELLLFDPSYYLYLEREDYLYYIVNRVGIDSLKDQFITELSIKKPFSEHDYWKIYDRGSLHLDFTGKLKDYPDIEIFTAIHGRDELDEARVADFGHDFYDELSGIEYQTDDYYSLHPALIHPFENRSIIHNENDDSGLSTESMSVNFWLRIEDEGLTKDSIYSSTAKRVFTFNDMSGNEVFHLQYRGNKLELFRNDAPLNIDLENSSYGELFTSKLMPNDWFLISFVFDRESGELRCAIDGSVLKTITLDEIDMARILAKGAMYYFGHKEENEYNTGFFSVAQAYYLNEELTEKQLTRLANFKGKNVNPEIEYWFRGMTGILDQDADGYKDGESDLYIIGNPDYYAAKENHDYLESSEDGAFTASGIHLNYLTPKEMNEKTYLTFIGEDSSYYLYNMNEPVTDHVTITDPLTGTDEGILLSPKPGSAGRYYFGDKNSNYSLGQDRWYSISGFISELDAENKAEIVLSINNREQRMELENGPFHFVYDNKDKLIPDDVNLFIETNGSVVINNNIVFNMGNFTIDDTIKRSAGSTFFAYDLSGSIQFWYKTLMDDKDGYVSYPLELNSGKTSYREIVLFDSELIKIGAKRKTENEKAYYYALLKSNAAGAVEADNILWTEKQVAGGWEHFQLSYDLEKNTVYFYINGKLSASKENLAIEPFGSIKGDDVPPEDNTFIGCDREKNYYAEGYLDQIYVGKYYLEPKFQDKKPVNIAYNTESHMIELTANNVSAGSVEPGGITAVLESMDDNSRKVFYSFPIDMLNYPGGRYRLTTNLRINGHNYKNIITYNITEKPRFNLVSHTPLVFMNKSTKINFNWNFDHSYKLENQELQYAGVGIKLGYAGTGAPRTYILVQDFIDKVPGKWLYAEDLSGIYNWGQANVNEQGHIVLETDQITSTSDVVCDIECFYFKNIFTGLSFNNEEDITIPLASLGDVEYSFDIDKQYKIMVPLSGSVSNGADSIIDKIEILYEIKDKDKKTLREGITGFNFDSGNSRYIIELYYDDVLPGYNEDPYFCDLTLKYNGTQYGNKNDIEMLWKAPEGVKTPKASFLEIKDYTLLYLDKLNNKVKIFLQYESDQIADKNELGEFVDDEMSYTISVKKDNRIFGNEINGKLSSVFSDFISGEIDIPKESSIIKIVLKAYSKENHDIGFIRSREIEVNNSISAPEVLLTNSVDSLIAYNNVFFSWKGYYEEEFNRNIEYTYNLDNSGWITPNNQWRKVSFYELSEGYHTFQVKAIYNELESAVRTVSFFVDVNKPRFDMDRIDVEKVYDTDGICYAVTITGEEGAVIDASLRNVSVNGEEITLGENGAFQAYRIPVTEDGINKFTITAIDRVGNYTEYIAAVDNSLTTIIFPETTRRVEFAPLTVVGRISSDIHTNMEIYIIDPFCSDSTAEKYSGWKKAIINEDRTFFVENIFVNPGTADKEILTELVIVSVFDSGKEFRKTLKVKANTIRMPIEMNLTTHASEGEGSNTYVEINCSAQVENISSWSIDYTGDGNYDEIESADNLSTGDPRVYKKVHKYSTIGLVEPRVRIITKDGNFFSVSDKLAIHEKIKPPSNAIAPDPISMDSISVNGGSEKWIYVLRNSAAGNIVTLYSLPEPENYVYKIAKTKDINIHQFGIEDAANIRVLDSGHILIASNSAASNKLYELVKNTYGNYTIEKEILLPAEVNQMTFDDFHLYLSFKEYNYIAVIDLVDSLLVEESLILENPEVYHTYGLGRNAGINKDERGLLVADYYNQRIIRFSHSLKMIEQFGTFGDGEKEFLKPSLIKSYKNRIFIYDEGRKDIQVFDQNLDAICTLSYELNEDFDNYVDRAFFNDIADISVFTKIDRNILNYYALILSKSTEQLSLIKLPQFEKLRARMQNNKIVFVKEGEIFYANPDGSDLSKLLASDSLPEIEGKLTYPALASDGNRLIFTSKMKLYNGEDYGYVNDENEHAYDHLYMLNLKTRELDRIDLGILNNNELERPVFNYNSNKIIFSARASGDIWQIYTYDLETRGITKIFDTDENLRFPYFSPDDRFIVFTTDFDGDEDIAVVDVNDTNIRYYITKNDSRDSFPVWSGIYKQEEVVPANSTDEELKKVDSKISFVSERGQKEVVAENFNEYVHFHKGVYTSYIKRLSEGEIQVFDLRTSSVNAQDPDEAAIEITTENVDGDYPCFTGDGRSLLFEHFDGDNMQIKKFDYYELDENDLNAIHNHAELKSSDPDFILEDVEVLEGAVRPAGMKNTITNFIARVQNGNALFISWAPYTKDDHSYIIEFNSFGSNPDSGEKQVYGVTETTIEGLALGNTYEVRVCLKEEEEVVATSCWKNVVFSSVIAKPAYEIDEDNPYVVKLSAWTPGGVDNWKYTWFVDNKMLQGKDDKEIYYEFATSGRKMIELKVNDANSVDTSDPPLFVDIVSDIVPVIEYELKNNASSIYINSKKSLGKDIDDNDVEWTISGPQGNTLKFDEAEGTITINGFEEYLNITLTLKRKPVDDQAFTDTISKTIKVDLDYRELKPVITYKANPLDPLDFIFSGDQSLGNIDWTRAVWKIFGENKQLLHENGGSAINHKFTEYSKDMAYSVSLSIPRKNDNKTASVSRIIYIEAVPLEPAIDYEFITMVKDNNTIGYKLVLDCTKNSKGNGINFSNARWAVPIPYTGETSVQTGPTAIYNLLDISDGIVLEVALTLYRNNGDAKTVIEYLELRTDKFPEKEIRINDNIEDSNSGKVLILDVLQSTGPNISWGETEWLIDGQYSRKGPVVRIDIPASEERKVIPYSCTLYRFGTEPQIEYGMAEIGMEMIMPEINVKQLSSDNGNYYQMDVLDSRGINIDWGKTEWYIYDGNSNVVLRQGAKVFHAFSIKEDKMGYQVMVNMYFKGGTKPFIGYKNIDIEGNELVPVIEPTVSEDDPNTFLFSAHTSSGANIDWSQTKWTFLDSSQAQYGPMVSHTFPSNSAKKSYIVALTLYRKLSNGQVESKTETKEITLGSAKITPIVKAKVYGTYLVLSAEDSLGNGLLLDRAMWMFPGKGDNTNYSSKIQGGVIEKDSYNFSKDTYRKNNINLYTHGQVGTEFETGAYVLGSGTTFHLGGENGIFFKAGRKRDIDIGSSTGIGAGKSVDVLNYDNYQDDSSSFSSSNMHTGTVCRRTLVPGQTHQIVTLYVFRLESDGAIRGESITVKVDIEKAKAEAAEDGVSYK